MLPIESSQSQTAIPIQPRQDLSKQPQKLNCFQCSCHITSKPEFIQIKVMCVQMNGFTSRTQLFLMLYWIYYMEHLMTVMSYILLGFRFS